jgi:hypothetical protein
MYHIGIDMEAPSYVGNTVAFVSYSLANKQIYLRTVLQAVYPVRLHYTVSALLLVIVVTVWYAGILYTSTHKHCLYIYTYYMHRPHITWETDTDKKICTQSPRQRQHVRRQNCM